MQDLPSREDPTQETYVRDHANYMSPTGQHELDRARSEIDLPCKLYVMKWE